MIRKTRSHTSRFTHHALRRRGWHPRPLNGLPASFHHAVGHFSEVLFENETKGTARLIIRRSHEVHAVGMPGQIIAFFERPASRIVRVVHRHGQSTIFFNDRETGHIRGAIANIDHVPKRHPPGFFRHMVIDILFHIQQALVHSKQKLRLLRVTDRPLRKTDVPLVLIEFAPKYGFDVFGNMTAVQNGLEPRTDYIVFEMNIPFGIPRLVHHGIEFFETIRHAWEKREVRPHGLQIRIGQTANRLMVQHPLHVRELLIISPFRNKRGAAPPKLGWLDAGMPQDGVILHVVRTERVIEIVDNREDVLWFKHDELSGNASPLRRAA